MRVLYNYMRHAENNKYYYSLMFTDILEYNNNVIAKRLYKCNIERKFFMSNLRDDDKVKVKVDFGGGFWGLLTIAFIVLKLTGVIDWPWIWVLCPIWGGIALVLIITIILFVIASVLNK